MISRRQFLARAAAVSAGAVVGSPVLARLRTAVLADDPLARVGLFVSPTNMLDRWTELYAMTRRPGETDDALRARFMHRLDYLRVA